MQYDAGARPATSGCADSRSSAQLGRSDRVDTALLTEVIDRNASDTNFFIRKGWDTYVSDAVERGRSGFASPDVWPSEPTFLTYQDPFERFRIGDSVVTEERAEGILLRPIRAAGPKLSWEELARAMASAAEDWTA